MNARRKGVEFERAVVRKLKALGLEARRCFQFRNQIDNVPDVDAGAAWVGGDRLWIECKSGRLNVAAVYRETAAAAKRAKHGDERSPCPCVVHKSSVTGPVLITLSLEDLATLTDGNLRSTF